MKRFVPPLLGLVMAASCATAHADDERQSIEMLRETTLNLIKALVEAKVLSQEQADTMLASARQKAAQTVADAPLDESDIRVAYVPESVREDMREQIKREVMTQARAEGWAQPDALPDWIKRIKVEGDIRLRYQTDNYASDNTTPEDFNALALTNLTTRAVDLATTDSNGIANGNTRSDVGRWRVRARLGVLAEITKNWSAGLRLSTGNTRDRVSTNQTLGQDFNKYSFLVERAYIQAKPYGGLSLTGGRIPNPWFSTDLMWDRDLNFEGVAVSYKFSEKGDRFRPYATVGYFPVTAEDPPARDETRALVGAQFGVGWDLAAWQQLNLGIAMYDYRDFEGLREPDAAISPAGDIQTNDYGSTQYGSSLRQKGNTLFAVNASADTTNPLYFGLASKFRPVNLTGEWILDYWYPTQVALSADFVYNTAFDKKEIRDRTGLAVTDASATAWRLGVSLGQLKVESQGDWKASLVYKRIGSDALLDAFTDSDFGGGGTNLKGFVLAFDYGVARNTSLGLRYSSADTIASPTLRSGDRFGLDTLQVDLGVSF